MSSAYKLIYFQPKWLGEPIRYIFHFAKVDFEDCRVEFGEHWQKNKSNYPYSRLPLLEHEDLKLSQSYAILRYISKQFNLNGKNDKEAAKVDEYADVLKDVLKEIEQLFNEASDEEKAKIMKNIVENTIPGYFGKIEKDLASTKEGKYLVGDNYTWADFLMASYTENFEFFLGPNYLASYPAIRSHQNNVKNIPQIKEYIAKRTVTEF